MFLLQSESSDGGVQLEKEFYFYIKWLWWQLIKFKEINNINFILNFSLFILNKIIAHFLGSFPGFYLDIQTLKNNILLHFIPFPRDGLNKMQIKN